MKPFPATSFGGRRRAAAGFTLMEMMITLSIFVILCSCVFGLMTSVMESAASVQDNQNRRDQIEHLNAFLAKKVHDLPAQRVLISYRRGDGEGLDQNGILMGQDQNLIAIDAKVQPNGYYTLRFTRFDPDTLPNSAVPPSPNYVMQLFQSQVSKDTGVTWTPLIKDVVTAEWKFQNLNAAANDWEEMWSDYSNTPNILQLSIQQAGDLQPSVMDFWVPPLVAATSVTSGVQAGGGGRGGRGGGGEVYQPRNLTPNGGGNNGNNGNGRTQP